MTNEEKNCYLLAIVALTLKAQTKSHVTSSVDSEIINDCC